MHNNCIDCTKDDSSFKKIKYDFIEDEESVGRCTPKYRRSLLLKVSFATFQLILGIFLVIFVIIPLVYKFSYSLQRAAVFLNFKNIPISPDYKHPQKYGLEGARNFYLTNEDGISLGVWQIVPESEKDSFENRTDQDFEEILSNGQNIVLYNHGNGGCRLSGHRVELYKVLRKHFHVIAFDYRSYGDSSDVPPTEDNVVQDVIFMIKWVKERAKGGVFIWGHSLGTSLATHALSRLQPLAVRVTGLILESPFNNMREEISEFPLARLFKSLPWFSYTVVEPMQENNFLFKTDVHICHVDVPILILHAVDDNVVPFKLGFKLFEAAQKCKSNNDGSVTFHKFPSAENYGHKNIYLAPTLSEIISDFITKATKETETKNLL